MRSAKMETMETLAAQHLTVEYQMRRTQHSLIALQSISFTIESGKFISIIGPSGCGKSTLLNVIAGLVPCTSGQVTLNGNLIRGPGRDRAMVFQAASLMPWRTVIQNAAYGLELQGIAQQTAQNRAQTYLALTGLHGFEHSYPHELSGGMQQRVNLARALTIEPSVLLLDEPLSSLDALTREAMQFELQRIWLQARQTAILVTHDIGEAIFLADEVWVMSPRPGQIRARLPVTLPRPRLMTHKRQAYFVEMQAQIWQILASDQTS